MDEEENFEDMLDEAFRNLYEKQHKEGLANGTIKMMKCYSKESIAKLKEDAIREFCEVAIEQIEIYCYGYCDNMSDGSADTPVMSVTCVEHQTAIDIIYTELNKKFGTLVQDELPFAEAKE